MGEVEDNESDLGEDQKMKGWTVKGLRDCSKRTFF
jgi:hypothetical protein